MSEKGTYSDPKCYACGQPERSPFATVTVSRLTACDQQPALTMEQFMDHFPHLPLYAMRVIGAVMDSKMPSRYLWALAQDANEETLLLGVDNALEMIRGLDGPEWP